MRKREETRKFLVNAKKERRDIKVNKRREVTRSEEHEKWNCCCCDCGCLLLHCKWQSLSLSAFAYGNDHAVELHDLRLLTSERGNSL